MAHGLAGRRPPSGRTILSTLSAPIAPPRPLSLLIVSADECWPSALHDLIEGHGPRVLRADSPRQACDPALLGEADAVVICELPDSAELSPESQAELRHRDLQLLADALASHRLTGILLTHEPASGGPLEETFIPVSDDISAEELWGRVATVRQYRPLLRQIDQQVAVMQRLGKKLNQQFVEVDQELRLASRLQRDFLPKNLPALNDIRFAALFRPATWVSGDIYDVTRLDENHVGFYVADAVGHGIAAGLLTMFIKQAIVGKRIHDRGYTLVPPSEVLDKLNVALAQQELPNCQFVTAIYGLINTATGRVTFARGGHPHPIHVNADGICAEVRTVGGLLGVFPEESFASTSVQLEPGDKLIIYSDGLEDFIIADRDRHKGLVQFTPQFEALVNQPAQACITSLAAGMDNSEGSLQPLDDMTVLAIERSP